MFKTKHFVFGVHNRLKNPAKTGNFDGKLVKVSALVSSVDKPFSLCDSAIMKAINQRCFFESLINAIFLVKITLVLSKAMVFYRIELVEFSNRAAIKQIGFLITLKLIKTRSLSKHFDAENFFCSTRWMVAKLTQMNTCLSADRDCDHA